MTKTALLLCAYSFTLHSHAQQKTVPQGYLEIKVKYRAPSIYDIPPPPPPPPPGMGIEMPPPAAETAIEITADDGKPIYVWFNKDFEKVVISPIGKTTILLNHQTKTTITLTESFGMKSATIATPEDEEKVNRYLDSLEGKKQEAVILPKVVYTEEQKTVTGYFCKKAFLLSEIPGKKTDTAVVWYCPDYKLPENFVFVSDQPKYNSRLAPLKLINGLPLLAALHVTPKTEITWEIVKIDTETTIAAKEFTVPKKIQLSPITKIYGIR